MKSLQAPNLKTIVLTKAIDTAIRSYDEQAFDNMSEESEKKHFIVKKSLWLVPSQGMVEQAKKNMAASDPSEVTQRVRLKTPESKVAEDAPDEGYCYGCGNLHYTIKVLR